MERGYTSIQRWNLSNGQVGRMIRGAHPPLTRALQGYWFDCSKRRPTNQRRGKQAINQPNLGTEEAARLERLADCAKRGVKPGGK